MKGRLRRTALRLFGMTAVAAICSASLFVLCYDRDNKYTAKGPRAENGVLILSEQDVQEHPLVYLTTGWELYRGKLLSPKDFTTGPVVPDEYVFIGQYGGLEGKAGSRRSPHGSATYRLNIALPPETGTYLLEVPEIYSAYRLYINGEQMAQMGRPEKDGYRAEIGNRKVVVRCANRMEVIVAVSDYSHFYSGMVYPPAFGQAQAVETLLNIRFGVRFAGVALSAGVGLRYFGIWLLLKKNRDDTDGLPLLYGALCFSFALYICYPIVKTLTTTGVGWYALENLSLPALLLLVTAIQSRICGLRGLPAKIMTALGVFVCGWAAAVPFALSGSLNLMMAHSAMLTAYTWIAALFLLLTSAISAYGGNPNSEILLAGAVVFGTSLVMDRLLPLFEPIRSGWFAELSGGFFVFCIGAVMAMEVAAQFRLRLQLEGRVERVTRMMEVQKAYYPKILSKEEDLRKARHDFRHHMAVIRELAAAGNLTKLLAYTESFGERMNLQGPTAYCKHYVTDMLLRLYAGLATAQDTVFAVEASLPDTLPFVDVDLCVMMSNLLENALEASLTVPGENRRIAVGISCKMNHFGMIVENTFDGVIRKRGSRFLSRKQNGREGIGLLSVQTVCQSYGGSAEFEIKENNVFRSELLLPMRGRGGKHS